MNPNIGQLASIGGKARMALLNKRERIAFARRAALFPRKSRQRPLRERFDARWMPEPFSGCWLWSGDIQDHFGYGLILVGKQTTLAHRVSWELHCGPIPAGLCVCHHCDNPNHLFVGTHLDNMRDKMAKNRIYWNAQRRHAVAVSQTQPKQSLTTKPSLNALRLRAWRMNARRRTDET